MGGCLDRVTSKELTIFPRELRFFEKLKIFQVEGVILGWLKLLRGVIFFFLVAGGGGGEADIFPEA